MDRKLRYAERLYTRLENRSVLASAFFTKRAIHDEKCARTRLRSVCFLARRAQRRCFSSCVVGGDPGSRFFFCHQRRLFLIKSTISYAARARLRNSCVCVSVFVTLVHKNGWINVIEIACPACFGPRKICLFYKTRKNYCTYYMRLQISLWGEQIIINHYGGYELCERKSRNFFLPRYNNMWSCLILK